MTKQGRLPDFIIIGAAKSGTSSLFEHLRQHPFVFGSDEKEPCYFDPGVNWERGIDWYRSLFADAREDQLCGEGSTNYTRYPQVPGVPERIRAVVPEVKLIYLMRHPVERAFSHYVHRFTKEVFPRRPFDVPFEEFVERDPMCVDGSEYALQIERYLEHFPRAQLLLLRLEELNREPASLLRKVQEFLGLPERELVRAQGPIANDTESFLRTRVRQRFSATVKQVPGAQALARRLSSHQRDRLFEMVLASSWGARIQRGLKPPPLRPDTRQRLLERYAPEIDRLEVLMGEPLDDWRV